MSPRRRIVVAYVAACAAGVAPALAAAAGTVGPAQLNAAGLPIDVADAVLPIDLSGSVVAGALKQDLGGAPATIVATGHGEAEPVAPNQVNGKGNPAGRAQNRRVTIAFPRT